MERREALDELQVSEVNRYRVYLRYVTTVEVEAINKSEAINMAYQMPVDEDTLRPLCDTKESDVERVREGQI